LGKEDDPYTITEERAVEIIEAKRKADAEKVIKSFDKNPEVQVLNGRYGAYIKVGKQNVRIPKGKDPKTLTLEECLTLAEEQNSDKAKTNTKSVSKKTEEKKTTKK
jgi:DNA topoisomerase-1